MHNTVTGWPSAHACCVAGTKCLSAFWHFPMLPHVLINKASGCQTLKLARKAWPRRCSLHLCSCIRKAVGRCTRQCFCAPDSAFGLLCSKDLAGTSACTLGHHSALLGGAQAMKTSPKFLATMMPPTKRPKALRSACKQNSQ